MIGECGLDTACTTPISLQRQAFVEQLSLSETLQKPVVVHCVRAFNELLLLRKQQVWSQPWVVHGFIGAPQLVLQLAQAGIHVSFGDALLDERHSKVIESLRSLWLRHLPFFLETDESASSINDIYRQAAAILTLPQPLLETTIETSLATLLSPKSAIIV